MILIFAYFCVISFYAKEIDAKIGINWARQKNFDFVPSMVVDLLLQNRVSEVKLHINDDNTIRAFYGTGIGVTLVIDIKEIDSFQAAKDWVQSKIALFPGVNIRHVLVGNNAFANARFKNTSFLPIVNSIRWMQQALNEAGYGKEIKAILTHTSTGVLNLNRKRPSEAEFLDILKESMNAILQLMKDNDIPFFFDIFPIAYIYTYHIDNNFAFCDNKSKYIITEANGLVYNNLFDFVHDSFVWALEKAGFPNLKIMVGQIGWPTDGFPIANVLAAERFYKSFLPKVASNIGTPMRPGMPIDIYVHSLIDEKNNTAGFPFMRHWGIYRTNGEPKYKMDLSGQGRDIFPTTAIGNNLMPGRWCVFNGKMYEPNLVQKQFDFACSIADCTSLARGASCSILNFTENISYAFNAYFQSQFQNEKACKFEGLGEVSLQDPTRDGCIFSIEIVKGTTHI